MALPGLLLHVGLKQLFNVSSKEACEWIDSRFHDSSRSVLRAVFDANRRAWHVVGLALLERSRYGWVTDLGREADLKAARDELRPLLALITAEQRAAAAEELAGLQGRFHGPDLVSADGVDALRRFSEPAGVAAAADRAAGAIADTLSDAPNLALALRSTPDGQTPLFQTVYRYYFRKLVGQSAELSAALLHDRLRALEDVTDARTAGLLGQIDLLFDRLDDGFAAVGARLDAGFAGLGADLRAIQERLSVPRKPGVSYDTGPEREFLLNAREQFRRNAGRVSAGQWERLGDALAEARLFAAAGEAHEVAAGAAAETRDAATEAANRFKAYRDACETGAWPQAFDALWKAVELEPARYAPFDRHRYRPERVLGAGAFGTVFLCFDEYEERPVAIKSFRTEALGRDLATVFAEARVLKALAHPNIIGVIDQGFGNTAARERPYLVLEYFRGQTLDHVGQLALPDFVTIARQVAEAVHAAHTRPQPVFHRDLKPSNVMALQDPDGTWAVRVIDFGLAVRADAPRAGLSVPPGLPSTRDRSATGTPKYAPPEQLGDLAGVSVGPYSDVYSFGKTCLDVLFGTTFPKSWDWGGLPVGARGALQNLFERCTADALRHRYRNFEPVLQVLAELDRAGVGGGALGEPAPRLVERAPGRVPGGEMPGAKTVPQAGRVRVPGEKVTLTLPGAVPVTFAWCPPGTFLMGGRAHRDEKPVHEVALTKGFFVGVYPVTQAQWGALMGTAPSHFKGPNRPVEQVSWDDAREFCRAFTESQKGRVTVRLPTEAEWEYACRAGTTSDYHFGDAISPDRANYDAGDVPTAPRDAHRRRRTTEVGSFAANPWGLHDVHGNVWEWCADGFGDYSAAHQVDPQGGADPNLRVLRGGSWQDEAGYSRSACRQRQAASRRYFSIGFRVCFGPV
ncbi:MAG TPA: bifunctional serine/threonine-protein kinase/formylglycine-generating enzyme family protein [Gemmata sp.]